MRGREQRPSSHWLPSVSTILSKVAELLLFAPNCFGPVRGCGQTDDGGVRGIHENVRCNSQRGNQRRQMLARFTAYFRPDERTD